MNKKLLISWIVVLAWLVPFVPTSYWVWMEEVDYITAANRLADEGIIVNRKSNPSLYKVDSPISRQELVWIIAKMTDAPSKKYCENIFSDVSATKPNTWACARIEWLLSVWAIAKNDKFRPTSNLSKAEAIGLIAKTLYPEAYAQYQHSGTWQEKAIDFTMWRLILLEKVDNPNEPATRGFIFKMLFYANDLGAYKNYGDGSKKNSEVVNNNESKTDNNQSNSASKANLQSWVLTFSDGTKIDSNEEKIDFSDGSSVDGRYEVVVIKDVLKYNDRTEVLELSDGVKYDWEWESFYFWNGENLNKTNKKVSNLNSKINNIQNKITTAISKLTDYRASLAKNFNSERKNFLGNDLDTFNKMEAKSLKFVDDAIEDLHDASKEISEDVRENGYN